MKRLLSVLMCCLLIGCEQHSVKRTVETPITTPMVMTAGDVTTCLQTNGIFATDCSIRSDARYMLPTEEWFVSKFPAFLRDFQFDLRQLSWAAEANDCDDFAKMAAAFAKLLHANTAGRAPVTSLAIGEFYYTKDSGEFHAINFAIVRVAAGQYKILFLEPQSCKIIKLSKEEIASCANWLL